MMLFQDVGGDTVEELHEFTSNGMLAVVLIHIAGVVASSLMHRENLVRSMITGFKSAKQDQGIRSSYAWLGVIMLTAVVAFWVGYPSVGMAVPGADATQAEQHDDD